MTRLGLRTHEVAEALGVPESTVRAMTRDGDVYVSGDMKVAWFKDPDGNILNVTGR